MDFSYVTTEEVDLTSAQILALATTPIQVLPAPEPGMMWEILSTTISLTYSTAAYSGSADLYYGVDHTGQALSSALSTVIAYTASKITTAKPALTGVVTANLLNQPVYVAASSNPTTGAGTVKITVVAVQVGV